MLRQSSRPEIPPSWRHERNDLTAKNLRNHVNNYGLLARHLRVSYTKASPHPLGRGERTMENQKKPFEAPMLKEEASLVGDTLIFS